jgi:hypothetical protein
VFVALAWCWLLLAASCVSLLNLASYQDVAHELCIEASRCEPSFDVAICEQHLTTQLTALNTADRTAWLTSVAESAATSTCLPAQQAIDSPLLCLSARAACGDGVQCCHFSAAVAHDTPLCVAGGDKSGKQCCEARGFTCQPGDCCDGDCQKGSGGISCCGGECCEAIDAPCSEATDCCSGNCRSGVCREPCAGPGDTCTSDAGCCEGAYCDETAGRCHACSAVGAGCSGSKDDPACCGNTCFVGSVVGGVDVCTDCDGLPLGVSCDPNVSNAAGNEGACCSGICDGEKCAECRTPGASCSGAAADECCKGLLCKQGECQECLPDGGDCSTSGDDACCSGTCLRGACVSCANLDEVCVRELDAACCQGVCEQLLDTMLANETRCQCPELFSECDYDSDCCSSTRPAHCKEVADVDKENLPGPTPQIERCCSTELPVECDPCQAYPQPLAASCATGSREKAIASVCASMPECCCIRWDKSCAQKAEDNGMLCAKPEPGT